MERASALVAQRIGEESEAAHLVLFRAREAERRQGQGTPPLRLPETQAVARAAGKLAGALSGAAGGASPTGGGRPATPPAPGPTGTPTALPSAAVSDTPDAVPSLGTVAEELPSPVRAPPGSFSAEVSGALEELYREAGEQLPLNVPTETQARREAVRRAMHELTSAGLE